MFDKQITIEMIKNWEEERNAKKLLEALTTDSDEIRKAAAKALKNIDDPKSIKPEYTRNRVSRSIQLALGSLYEAIYMPNKWGLIGVLMALVSWIANYLNMNTLMIGEFVLRRPVYRMAIVPSLILFATYVPILLGITGLLLVRERERFSSIFCLVVAIAGICWLQWTKADHRYQVQRAEVIADKVEAYAQEHSKYPEALSDLKDVTDSDLALVVLIPGGSPGQKVTFTPSLGGQHMPFTKAEAPRVVFYLKDVVGGYRVVYQSNGKLATVSETIDFNTIVSASR